MPHTYILRCVDGTLYVGSTTDLAHRLRQHESGEGAEYTRRRRPVSLVWSGEFERIDDAFALEKQLQNWSREKRLAFIEGGFAAVREVNRRHRRAGR